MVGTEHDNVWQPVDELHWEKLSLCADIWAQPEFQIPLFHLELSFLAPQRGTLEEEV